MSLPLVRWLSRPLARFLRHTWMSRTLLWPAGLDSVAAFLAPRKKPPVKPDARIALEALEQRFTPQDFLNVLKMGVSVGGIALISGQLPTPMSVALHGWDCGEPALPAAVPTAPADPRPEPAMPQPNPGQMEALASFDMNAAQEQAEATSTPAEQPVSTTVEPAGQGGQADNSMQSWLDSVGAVLGSQPEQPSVAASAAPSAPTNGGGGGGGGSSGPASTLSTPPPAAPLSTSSANVPSADTAAQMIQQAGTLALPSGTTAAAKNGAAVVSGGASQGTTQAGSTAASTTSVPPTPSIDSNYSHVPLSLELNQGQDNSSVLAESNGSGLGFWLTSNSLVFAIPHVNTQTGQRDGSDDFALTLENASASPQVVPSDLLPGVSNYFTGGSVSRAFTDVPQYGEITLQNVYPGVDVDVHAASGDGTTFEYDFVAQPGADLSAIRLDPQGLQGVTTNAQGQLVLATSGGNVIMDNPDIYQTIDGQQTNVAGGFVLNSDGSVGFQLTGQYNASDPLVIDPSLSWSTYDGGTSTDIGYGIATDASGNVYVTGQTAGSFPYNYGYQSSAGDTFVAKFNALGQNVYSTYLGNTSTKAVAIAVDLSGAAYVVGQTGSTYTGSAFPTTTSAYATSFPGTSQSSFLTKFNTTGDELDYSTYFGGDDVLINAVAVDAYGQAHIAGTVTSGGSIATTAGALQTSSGGGSDMLMTEFNAAGSSLLDSTYIGGSGNDGGNGIALDTADNIYITGTSSGSFPTTAGAYQTSLGGGSLTNAVIVKLNPAATSKLYSTYDGSSTDTGVAVAVDRSNQAYIIGAVGSHAFVSALNAAGTSLVYSNVSVSGNGTDVAADLAVTGAGAVTAIGSTTSTNLPATTGALQTTLQGNESAFVLQLTSAGSTSYLTYLGGSSTGGGGGGGLGLGGGGASTTGAGVALGPTGIAYVTGTTNATNFPVSSGAYQSINAGSSDIFVSEFLPGPAAPAITSPNHYTTSTNLTISGTATPSTTVTLERADLGVLGTASVGLGGTWTYNYTATTLTQDTYDFIARDTTSGAAVSPFSPDYLVTVDDTAPTVTLEVPATTATLAPYVQVIAKDQVAMPATTTLTLDLSSTSGTGPWTLGYATATMTQGEAQITLPALPSTGTYWLRAKADDLAGNQGSVVESFTVNSVTSWSGAGKVLTADPLEGDAEMQLGNVSFSHPLDLDQSPGTSQGGNPALVYNSDEVSQQPIVQVQLTTPNNASLPATISADFYINSVNLGTTTYSTTGLHEGDKLTLALQDPTAITTTGSYTWSVVVTAGSYNPTFSGSGFVVALDSSPFGAGWSFAGVNQLYGAGGANPVIIYGTGGYRQYTGTTTFSSPVGDNGTLTLSGGTYTYSTPDGETWTYNSSGEMTQWTSPDGNETLQYRYDGSDRLTGITAIDGALTTLTYTSGTNSTVTIDTVNSRTWTLGLSFADLLSITNPDGGVETLTYDANSHVTSEALGMMENVWSYTSAGVLDTSTQGFSPTLGSSPSLTTFSPAVTQALGGLFAGTVQAISTNADGASVIETLDNQGRALSETAGDGGTTTMTYSNGFLSSETDPLGNTTTYSLDSDGYVTQETFADGSTIAYQYQSAFHALTTMTDERGKTSTFAYDIDGHLTSATDALAETTTDAYTAGGLLETVTDANHHTSTYAYDSDLRPTTITDPTGAVTSIGYDANGNIHTIEDANLHTTTLNYDIMDRLTSTVNPASGEETFTYDISGLELTATDEMGVETQYVYDPYNRGLVVETITGVNTNLPVTTVDTYDADEKLIAQRDNNGGVMQYAYDPAGHVTSMTDALANTTQYDYDLDGQQYATRDPMGNWSVDSYNNVGLVTNETDRMGNLSTLAYDATGNLTAYTDALSHTSSYSYDAVGQLTTVEDPLTHVVTLAYDPVGNLSTTTDANGNVTSYAYDADDRLTKETEAVGTSVQTSFETAYNAVGDVSSTTDGNGHVATLAYDALDQVTTVTDALSQVTSLAYDAGGDATTVTDALSHTSTIGYDAIHDPITTTDPLTHTGTMVVDGAGETAATIDPLGNVTVAMIDPLGQTFGSVDALGNVTETVLDPDGNARLVTDADGNQTQYVYNRNGQVIQTITPLGTTTDQYDAAGRLTQQTDADGRVIDLSYDADDRPTGEVWKTSGGTTVNLETFTYDNDNNLLTTSNMVGTFTYTETYTYNALDEVQTYTNVWGQVLTYSYDGNENLTQRSDSLGGTLTYVYDAANELTSEKFSGSGSTGTAIRVDFGYDAVGDQTTITWYSNLSGTSVVADSAYSYNPGSKVTAIANANGAGATLSYYDYSYDTDERVSNQSYWSEVGTTVYSGSDTYTYDAISQLLSDSSATYSYDNAGNRNMSGYTTGSDNEMTSDGTYTYMYDAVGNLTEKTSGSGLSQITWTYSYDNANQLTGVVETQGGTTLTLATYLYDAEGDRVQSQVWTSGGGAMTTRFAIDPVNGGTTWADLDGSNNLLVRYNYGADGQILTRTVASGGNAGAWAYLTDDQGSVRDLVNWSGQVEDHLDYNAYGVVTESNQTVGDRFKYDGYQYETATGLYYDYARWYNPSTGTWQTQDPMEFAAGQANLNQYVGNDPTNLTDPTGFGARGGGPDASDGNGFLYGGTDYGNLRTVWRRVPGNTDPDNPPQSSDQDQESAYKRFDNFIGTYTGLKWLTEKLGRASVNEKNEYVGVGQPGFWEGLIPVWGSLRSAFAHYQNGEYFWGTVSTVFVVLDLMVVGSAIKAGRALITSGWRSFFREGLPSVGKLFGHGEYEVANATKAAGTKASLLAYFKKYGPKINPIEVVEGLFGAEIDTVTGKIRIGEDIVQRFPHLADGYLVEELKHFQQLHQRGWIGRIVTEEEEKLLEGEIKEFMEQSGFKLFNPR